MSLTGHEELGSLLCLKLRLVPLGSLVSTDRLACLERLMVRVMGKHLRLAVGHVGDYRWLLLVMELLLVVVCVAHQRVLAGGKVARRRIVWTETLDGRGWVDQWLIAELIIKVADDARLAAGKLISRLAVVTMDTVAVLGLKDITWWLSLGRRQGPCLLVSMFVVQFPLAERQTLLANELACWFQL